MEKETKKYKGKKVYVYFITDDYYLISYTNDNNGKFKVNPSELK